MIVRVTMHHNLTTTKGWQTRRMMCLTRRVFFGLSVAPLMCDPLGGGGGIGGVGLNVDAHPIRTTCVVTFSGNWSKAQVCSFVQFMKNAKDLTVQVLIPHPEPDTILA